MYSFFTIAFASFVDGQQDFSQSFSDWLKVCLLRFPLQVADCRFDVGKNGDLQVSLCDLSTALPFLRKF